MDTPLWVGIYFLPLTGSFMVAGPISGFLSDRYGARLFSTIGGGLMLASYLLLLVLPWTSTSCGSLSFSA